jgi:hypothetical protein
MVPREEIHDLLPVASGGGIRNVRPVGGTPDDPGVEQPHPGVEIATPKRLVCLTQLSGALAHGVRLVADDHFYDAPVLIL